MSHTMTKIVSVTYAIVNAP